jgi:hypothetical protein
MKALMMAAAAALCISACTRFGEGESASSAAGCAAVAATEWQGFNVEASTRGPDCARAAVMLVFRASGSGEIARMETHRAMDLMTLASVDDAAAMETALGEWIDQSSPDFATTADLPEWPANAEAPVSGEFPFYPAEGTTREAYDVIRARAAPLFCYVQGMESINCLALVDGDLDSVGVQTFPG